MDSSATSIPSTSLPLLMFDTTIVSGMVRKQLDEADMAAASRILTYHVPSSQVTVGISTGVMDQLNRIPEQFRQDHLDLCSSLMLLPKLSNVTTIDPQSTGCVTEAPDFAALNQMLGEEDAALVYHAIDRAPYHPWVCFVAAEKSGGLARRREDVESRFPIRVRRPCEVLSDLDTEKP